MWVAFRILSDLDYNAPPTENEGTMMQRNSIPKILILLGLLLAISALPASAQQGGDYAIPNGRFFTQAAGGSGGFSVLDDGQARFWSEFQRLGGTQTVGYPISRRYVYDGFVTQAFQKLVLQWRPEVNQAWPVNVFDELSKAGRDETLLASRQTPRPLTNFDPPGATWNQVVASRQALLTTNPAIRSRYFSVADPLNVFGLPVSRVEDMGNHFAVRTQRAVFQQWKEAVPWAAAGQVTIANGGDIAKELNWLPAAALQPESGPSAGGPSTPPAATAPTFSPIGVEITRNGVRGTAPRAKELGVSWVRYNGIQWPAVEQTQGNRDWAALSGVEAELQALAAQGLTTHVIIRGTPGWAQKVAGAQCGPIREDALDDFATFMGEVVTRYSQPPYNVKYWELGNEPDVDPALIDPEMPFGCWGDQNDPYYGGGYYATMLKQVYPAIKAADPAAQVIIGGLLLDCDPTNPPEGQDCKPSKFLEGILRNGGGSVFDIVAYHAYPYWDASLNDWELEHPKWNHRGGSLLGKLSFIRQTLAQYSVSKPVLMNEGGLLCYATCPEAALRDAQATYAVRMYARSIAYGLLGATWFTLDGPGWRQGGLLDASNNPRPAYEAIKFMTSLLNGASYARRISDDGLEGYSFRKENTTYWVYWTNDGSTRSIPAPAGTEAVYSRMGQPLTAGTTLSVGGEPIYVQVAGQ
jgi:hypothetical protein